MTGFWFGAAALSLAALAFVLVPLWRVRQRSGQWSVLGTGAAALLIPLAVGTHLGITTWNGESPGPGAELPPVAELVAGLQARLAENSDDLTGWRLLGQSYMALGRYEDARQVLRELWGRTSVPDNDLKLALGEAEALADRQALQGTAGQLFEEVLETEPANPKALWYAGLAAQETQRPELARERWTQLLSLGPPDPVAEVLRQQLSALGSPVAEPAEERVHVAQAEPAAGLELRLRISLADGVSADAMGANAALFIFARAPQGGPPVAVIRQSAAAVPGEFSLSDADAMLPGRSLADFEVLMIVARLSASGEPTAQPGDLFGELEFRPAEGSQVLDLVIDKVAE